MKAWKAFGFVLLLFGAVASGVYYFAQEQNRAVEYRVVRIIDGDTIEVEHKDKTQSVRLLGIDAPERNQCFYQESGTYLADIILDEKVTLKIDPLNDMVDEYGRLLRYVYHDDMLINQEMLEAGMATYIDFYPLTFDTQFEILEQQAREDDRGLWGEC